MLWQSRAAAGKPVGAFLRDSLRSERRGAFIVWSIAVIVWLATLIATPITIWTVGYERFPLIASVGVVAQFAASMAALACSWKAARILAAVAVVTAGSWLVEFVGHTTGVPFGHYEYTALLQPQIQGVPVIIPLAWMMMLAPAWSVVDRLVANRSRVGAVLVFAVLSGLALTAWDLYLDPQMVAKGLWVWDNPSGYFGIPWVNFLGWAATGAVFTLIIRPDELPRVPLLVIYSLTWVFQAIGLGLFWGQPGPALVGFMAMGLFTAVAWRKEYTAWKSSSGQ
ncbi:MAG: carotenoid biosynthesis protein [Chloroflexi bacterium]|nr:carotenoid biosynthesis protein [Chloroflexota bacterium]